MQNVPQVLRILLSRSSKTERTPAVPLFFPWRISPSGPGPPHSRGFTITLRHTTLGRTPLDQWPARRRDLYLTTLNKRQTSMPPAGFEPAIPTSERPQTHALDLAVSGIGLSTVFSRLYAGHWRALSGTILCSVEWWDDYRKPTSMWEEVVVTWFDSILRNVLGECTISL
jgi:hypothetical protein